MAKETKFTLYELTRNFWDFCFENPDLVKPNEIALYFFILEHNNRLGWKIKFGLPTSMAMEATSIKSYNTYKASRERLVKWGFIIMVQESKNQYSSCIIAVSKIDKANNKALDKALTKHSIKHSIKHSESTVQSTIQITDSIDKQYNNITSKQEREESPPQIQRRFLLEIKEVEEYLLSEIEWKTTRIATPLNLNIEKVDFLIKEFSETLKGRGEEQKTPADAKSHFYNWIKNKPNGTHLKSNPPSEEEFLTAIANGVVNAMQS